MRAWVQSDHDRGNEVPEPRSTEAVPLFISIREDLLANRGWPKSQFALTFFRVASACREPRDKRASILAKPVGILYRLIVEWGLGIEIPWRARIGRRPRLFHGIGLVINEETVVGDDVILRHGVTLGNNGTTDLAPTIGDGVDIGAGAMILGPVRIGSYARIGANAVVTKDVPERATAVGVPARVTREDVESPQSRGDS